MLAGRTIILIPTYNERDNIKSLLGALVDFLPDASILVIDDNSPDGTASIVERMTTSYSHIKLKKRDKKSGLGSAYREAFDYVLKSDFNTIVTMDADLSHDYREIHEMLRLRKSHDVVVGSRYISGGSIKNWNIIRRVLSRFANFYVRVILRSKIADFTSGYMCISRSVLEELQNKITHADGYAFLVEVKYLATKAGFDIFEYPILFTERTEGHSKMSWKIIGEAIIMPWRLLFRRR